MTPTAAEFFTSVSLRGSFGKDTAVVYVVFLLAALLIVYGSWAFRQLGLWWWRRNRSPVELTREPNVSTAVSAPSIETDLLIQRVTPLCQQVWMAAQKHDLAAVRPLVSNRVADRLTSEAASVVDSSPIANLAVISTSGDGDSIQRFQAIVTTESGVRRRWTFQRQGSGWLVDDVAA